MYLNAIKKGVAPEEIAGILFWQIKAIYLAVFSTNINSSGLKPFVYTKSLRYGKNFKKSEIEELAFELADIYHKARLGGVKMEIGLEKFILEKI